MIYEIIRAVLDSIIKWASTPRVVRVVGGGSRLAERVRSEIRKRAGFADADRASERQRSSRDA